MQKRKCIFKICSNIIYSCLRNCLPSVVSMCACRHTHTDITKEQWATWPRRSTPSFEDGYKQTAKAHQPGPWLDCLLLFQVSNHWWLIANRGVKRTQPSSSCANLMLMCVVYNVQLKQRCGMWRRTTCPHMVSPRAFNLYMQYNSGHQYQSVIWLTSSPSRSRYVCLPQSPYTCFSWACNKCLSCTVKFVPRVPWHRGDTNPSTHPNYVTTPQSRSSKVTEWADRGVCGWKGWSNSLLTPVGNLVQQDPPREGGLSMSTQGPWP